MKRKKANKSVAVEPAQNNPLVTALDLQHQGKLTEAEALFRQILRVAPTNQIALYSLAVILLNSGRQAEALGVSTDGVEANPDFAQLWLVHGSALQALHRREEALVSYDRALEINPKYIEVLVNSGALLRDMRRHHDALQRFRSVLDIDPEYETALGNYGILLTEFKQGLLAVEIFERLVRKNPDYAYGLGLLCYERMHLCDWTGMEAITQQITDGIHEGKKTCKTLGYMALSDSVSDHYLCASIFAKYQHQTRPVPLWQGEKYNHARIRLAYVSPDLREHPVGHLMAGVIEAHDKSRFETIAISIGIDDGSRIRSRMIAAFDHFIDAKDMSARQIAELMHQMEVDIAVDLAGYTSDARTEIFLSRPAPIQINYLGYPGTMALECYDHILADHTVIPDDHQQHYSEKVAYLDNCYLPIASGVEVAEPLARSAYGLPEQGFVFCAFSHDYKIHPKMFAIWMRLLEANQGSVLWLVSRNEVSQENLRKSAQLHGVSPDRLVFASRVPRIEDHLARYRVADLFLDTWPYNAHTTAADALLAGLPVVTYKGGSFPSRVAASLLETLGFDQLVTNSFEDYFTLANGLAHDPARHSELRGKLSPEKLQSHPFFGQNFTRSLEKVFAKLVEQESKGHLEQTGTPRIQVEQLLPPQPSAETVSALEHVRDLLKKGSLTQAEYYLRREIAQNGNSSGAFELMGALQKAYGFPEWFKLSERKPVQTDRRGRYLIIKAWGYGFWCEAHHVASLLLLAELTQRTPIVLWGKNCLFRNKALVNSFGSYFQEIASVQLEDIPWSATIFPAKWSWSNIYEEDVNKWAGEGSRVAAQYLFNRPEDVVVSDFFSTMDAIIPWIGRDSQYFGLSDDELYAAMFQKYLKPVKGITSRADDFHAQNMQGRPWVAVHVRGSDKIEEFPELAKTNAGYFGFIDRIVELNPSIGLFLLTDSQNILVEYKNRYGERLLCTDVARTSSNVGIHLSGYDGIKIGEEVMLDALLALKCDYFVGNKESNVSLAIASMRNWSKGFMFLLGETNNRSEKRFYDLKK